MTVEELDTPAADAGLSTFVPVLGYTVLVVAAHTGVVVKLRRRRREAW
ncbi:hypothetical protein [Amycolatopsis solani]|nr:hypothetical protein [Amycolatopsis sp. MEP2-6]